MPASSVLILEPNKQLNTPYRYLPDNSLIGRFETTQVGLDIIQQFDPSLVFLSCSYSLADSIEFLDAFKNEFLNRIVPLVFTIDMTNRLNSVPGTSWGGKVAVMNNQTSKSEFDLIVGRLFAV